MEAESEKTARNSKVSCRSRRAVTNILDITNQEYSDIIESSVSLTDDEKNRCKDRFKQIYETALQENVLIDGRRWSEMEQDLTTEFEPINLELQEYLENTLTQRWNDQLIETTKQRKIIPAVCKKNLKRKLNSDHIQLSNTQVKVQSVIMEPPSCSSSLQSEEVLQTHKTTSDSMAYLIKKIGNTLDKAKRIKKAATMCNKIKTCKTDKIILEQWSTEPTPDPANVKMKASQTYSLPTTEHPTSKLREVA